MWPRWLQRPLRSEQITWADAWQRLCWLILASHTVCLGGVWLRKPKRGPAFSPFSRWACPGPGAIQPGAKMEAGADSVVWPGFPSYSKKSDRRAQSRSMQNPWDRTGCAWHSATHGCWQNHSRKFPLFCTQGGRLMSSESYRKGQSLRMTAWAWQWGPKWPWPWDPEEPRGGHVETLRSRVRAECSLRLSGPVVGSQR